MALGLIFVRDGALDEDEETDRIERWIRTRPDRLIRRRRASRRQDAVHADDRRPPELDLPGGLSCRATMASAVSRTKGLQEAIDRRLIMVALLDDYVVARHCWAIRR